MDVEYLRIIRSKLKSLLPVTFLSIIGSGAIYLYQKSKVVALRTADTFATEDKSEMAANGMKVGDSIDMAADATKEAITETITTEPNLALWFLAGSLFVVTILYLIKLFGNKKI